MFCFFYLNIIIIYIVIKCHGDLFPKCLHGRMTTAERRTKWNHPGTKTSDKIESVVLAKSLKEDIVKLSPAEQTFPVEAFHSVINSFAPKLLAFSYQGMMCRLLLAVLHYNENSQKMQAKTKDGMLRYEIKFPKFKKSSFSVRKVKCDSTYTYVQQLLPTVTYLCCSNNSSDFNLLAEAPPSLSTAFFRPNKDDAIANHISRFSSL